MNVRTLIVSKAVADTMIKCADMVVNPNYDHAAGIRKLGMYGRYPVWVDPLLSDEKVMITYKADSVDDAHCKSMVERWRSQLDDDAYILLSGKG
jgi:hypothetical protein